MVQYTDNVGEQRKEDGSQVVCVWCGGVIRGGASKARKRMCQPCFERMMREHFSRAHQSPSDPPHASER